jgi:serine/threonine protein kinase
MAILSGKRLGPYEILSAIGAGGMGEVYRARDTRLERIVAVKILPDHLSDRAELRERFEREARTIASLKPNRGENRHAMTKFLGCVTPVAGGCYTPVIFEGPSQPDARGLRKRRCHPRPRTSPNSCKPGDKDKTPLWRNCSRSFIKKSYVIWPGDTCSGASWPYLASDGVGQ